MSELERELGGALGVDGGWLPLPTRPQQYCDPASLVFTMAEVHSCEELSNFHIVIWWSKIGVTDIARELLIYTECCPQSLKENALKGARNKPKKSGSIIKP